MKEYKSTIQSKIGKPRSKRLREAGIGSSSTSSVTVTGGGGSGSGSLDHSHNNLDTLDKLSRDEENYLRVQNVTEDSDGNTVIVQERAKVGYADVADDLKKNGAAIEWLKNLFLRKDIPETLVHLLKMKGGAEFGENGSEIIIDEHGFSHATVDYLYVRMKAIFEELMIKRKTYVGGEQIISHAAMKCIRVEELTESYRCYFLAEQDGVKIRNEFSVGSLAIAQIVNLETGSNQINHFYHRAVIGIGDDYIDLSKTICAPLSDAPIAGDDIVGLGHLTDKTLQSALIQSAINEVSPSFIMYAGIDSFNYRDKAVYSLFFDKSTGKVEQVMYGNSYTGNKEKTEYIQYKDGEVNISGKVKIKSGSEGASNLTDLPEEVLKAAKIGGENLLLNTSFSGNYESEELEENYSLEADSELYSAKLKNWDGDAEIIEDKESVSGYSAVIGYLAQSIQLIQGESYVISFKAKGSNISLSCGGNNFNNTLSDSYDVYEHRLVSNSGGTFVLNGDATVCEIKLERGTIRTDWSPSRLDNDKSTDKFAAIQYIQDAIKKGSTEILNGLLLTAMILLGNYKDGVMQHVTAGISGIYNDDSDVAFFSGGTLEMAIRTVMTFKQNPRYQPTAKEWESLAKFVVTHGGDAIFKGTVFADSGYFRGLVDIASGKILLNTDGSGHVANGTYSWDESGERYEMTGARLVYRDFNNSSIDGVVIDDFGNKVTDKYYIDLKKGTYIKNIGSTYDHFTIFLPEPSGVDGKRLEFNVPTYSRSQRIIPIDCESGIYKNYDGNLLAISDWSSVMQSENTIVYLESLSNKWVARTELKKRNTISIAMQGSFTRTQFSAATFDNHTPNIERYSGYKHRIAKPESWNRYFFTISATANVGTVETYNDNNYFYFTPSDFDTGIYIVFTIFLSDGFLGDCKYINNTQ